MLKIVIIDLIMNIGLFAMSLYFYWHVEGFIFVSSCFIVVVIVVDVDMDMVVVLIRKPVILMSGK